MRVISKKALQHFAELYPQALIPLQEWRGKIQGTSITSYAELKNIFNSVDKVGHYFIFNIAGKHYRLTAAIHFHTQTLYIRSIMTHKEYDQWQP
ncbi:MAG: type II toxin-antitoxin system HigB family toxin [Methylococcales bacterium]|nr:type II toxin-antitoxin system HigB family toxin [Methylococcales bacterium]